MIKWKKLIGGEKLIETKLMYTELFLLLSQFVLLCRWALRKATLLFLYLQTNARIVCDLFPRDIPRLNTNEPRHDKTNTMGPRPAWTQTSPRTRAVRSGSTLLANSFSTCNRVCKWTAWIPTRPRGRAGRSGSMPAANPPRWPRRDTAKMIFIK
jgi:hypothetical protein